MGNREEGKRFWGLWFGGGRRGGTCTLSDWVEAPTCRADCVNGICGKISGLSPTCESLGWFTDLQFFLAANS